MSKGGHYVRVRLTLKSTQLQFADTALKLRLLQLWALTHVSLLADK